MSPKCPIPRPWRVSDPTATKLTNLSEVKLVQIGDEGGDRPRTNPLTGNRSKYILRAGDFCTRNRWSILG